MKKRVFIRGALVVLAWTMVVIICTGCWLMPRKQSLMDYYGKFELRLKDFPFETKVRVYAGDRLNFTSTLSFDEIYEKFDAMAGVQATKIERELYLGENQFVQKMIFLAYSKGGQLFYFWISNGYNAGLVDYVVEEDAYALFRCQDWFYADVGGEYKIGYGYLSPAVLFEKQVDEAYFTQKSFEEICDFYVKANHNDYTIDNDNKIIEFDCRPFPGFGNSSSGKIKIHFVETEQGNTLQYSL
ncbi:MAG: hypothetical protein FWD76_02025 [Firmicutes bacterium]|nr:hypothetical protein [Bacillota bacterium]